MTEFLHPKELSVVGLTSLRMGRETGCHYGQYEDLPKGERMADRFSGFWRLGEVFDLQTLDLSILHLSSGERGPMHAHEAPIDEIYFVLEGEISVELADKSINGTDGTYFYFPPGLEHRPRNDSDGVARMLSIRSLAEGGSNFSQAEE